MKLISSLPQQAKVRLLGCPLRGGDEVASSGSTGAIGDAKAYLHLSGGISVFEVKGAELSQKPRGGRGRGLL